MFQYLYTEVFYIDSTVYAIRFLKMKHQEASGGFSSRVQTKTPGAIPRQEFKTPEAIPRQESKTPGAIP